MQQVMSLISSEVLAVPSPDRVASGAICNDDDKDDHTGLFPWATRAELGSQNRSDLIGKRVQIMEYTVIVLSRLAVESMGESFQVVVLEPKNQNGAPMTLQFRPNQVVLEPTPSIQVLTSQSQFNVVPPVIYGLRTPINLYLFWHGLAMASLDFSRSLLSSRRQADNKYDHLRPFPLVEHAERNTQGTSGLTGFRPFPWATRAELNSENTCYLMGRCVQIKEYKINVLSCLGFGRSGPTFKVVVLEPKSENGVLMALQYRQDQEGIAHLARAAETLQKMDEDDPVPHIVSLRAFGPLKVPKEPLCGCINLQPWQGDHGKALLMTLARGSPLNDISFDGGAVKTIFKKQMARFAESMYRKGLMHGNLSSENIYWNPDSQEATVTSFGNAVDRHAQDDSVVQRMNIRKDSVHEMVHFLGETFGHDKARAQTAIASSCTDFDELDACGKLDLLAGDAWRSTTMYGKREY